MPQGWGPPTDRSSAWPSSGGPLVDNGPRLGRQPWRWGSGSGSVRMSGVPDYLGWSIFCTILFCWPVGAVGIICSIVARRRAVAGDLDGALRASHTAKKCCWASFIVVVVIAALLLATGSHLPTLKS